MPGSSHAKPSFLGIILLLQVMSCLFFTYDVIKDIVEHSSDNLPYTEADAIHTTFEFIAVVGLLFGSISMWQTLQHNIQMNAEAAETIEIQKGHFDEITQSRFHIWMFTNSEMDVAKLILRGLSLKEIAAARSVSLGTVKAQTNAILKKSGVENRAAFLGLFIDEFLDDTIGKDVTPKRS